MDHNHPMQPGLDLPGQPEDRRSQLDALCAAAKEAMEQGRIDQAREPLEEAIRIDPDFVPALELLSIVYTLMEDTGRSRFALERLVALRPDDLRHRRALARLYLMEERYQEVIGTLEQEVSRRKLALMGKSDPGRYLTAEDILALAASYLRSRRSQEAISLLKSIERSAGQQEGAATWEIGLRDVLDRLISLIERADDPFLAYVYHAFPFARKARLALPLLHDWELLLEDIRHRPPRNAGEKGLSAARREKINRQVALREPPDGPLPRMRFLETLLWEAGLLDPNPPEIVLTSQGLEYLRKDPRDQFRSMLNTWLGGTRWNELFEIEGLRLCRGEGHRPYGREEDAQRDLRPRREILLKHLRDFDQGKLYPLETLWEKVAFHHPDFLRRDEERTGPHAWRFCQAKPDEEAAPWEDLEGRLIESFLKGPLNWFDLTGVIQRDDGRVTHFFLKPLIFFGQRPTGGVGKALTLTANMEIKVDLTVMDRFDLREVERFSELKLGYAETNVYRVTAPSIEQGLQKGLSLESFLACLERNHGSALPPTARHGILKLADPS